MNRIKQIIIALQVGFTPSHPILGDPLEEGGAGGIGKGIAITPEDLLDETSTGKSFFAYKETWNNIDKLLELCPDLKGEQLLVAAGDGKIPADYVKNLRVVDDLFHPQLWKGQAKAFDEAWEAYSTYTQYDSYLSAKRKIADVEGKTLREDQLVSMGVEYDDLEDAIRHGAFEEIREKLAAHGDYLRANDLLLPKKGMHLLDYSGKWDKFEVLWAELSANGEQMKPEHFLFHIGAKRSPLQVAIDSGHAGKIFNADIWVGRMDQMMELYKQAKEVLSPKDLKKIPIETAIKDITEREFADSMQIDKSLEKDFLVTGFHAPLTGKDGKPFTTTPLALQKTWENMGEIRSILQGKKQSLTLDELRQPTGANQENALFYAARFGCFDQVIAIAQINGEHITAADLVTKGPEDESLFDILEEQEMQHLILDPTLWVGKEDDLAELFDSLPKDRKDEIDFGNLLGQISVITLRDHFGKGASNRKTPPPPANDGPPARKFG